MDILSSEEKERITNSFYNKKFKMYSGYDLSLLFGAIVIGLFILVEPFATVLLNKYNFYDYFKNMFDGFGWVIIFVLMFITLLVISVQIVRINFINTGVYIELENNEKLLILNGILHKKYIVGGKVYIVKKNEVVKVSNSGENLFLKLISDFRETDIYKIVRKNETVYTTKLLDNGGYAKTALPEKYVRLIFRGDNLTKGILKGSQRQCSVSFKFCNANSKKRIKIPERIIENIKF